MPPKSVVSTLVDALRMLSRYDKEDACGFLVAPLATRGGGARSWHALSADGKEWIPENADGATVPATDVDTRTLPDLPESKINLWAFAFVSKSGNILRPEIELNPAAPQTKDPQAAPPPPPPPPPPPTPAPEPPPRRPPMAATPGDALGAMVEALRGAQEDTRLANAETRAMAGDSRLATSHAQAQNEALVGHYRAENERLRQRNDRIEGERDRFVSANNELAIALAEQKATNQIAETVRAIYGGEPEKFTEALRDLWMGGLQVLKNGA